MTNNEVNILIDLYADLTTNIHNIQTSRTNLIKIKKDITNLDNNFFETLGDHYLLNDYIQLFDDENAYSEHLTKLSILQEFIKNKIIKNCNHDWIMDTIDVDINHSRNICYCSNCEITKK